jgi:hypothetical protein
VPVGLRRSTSVYVVYVTLISYLPRLRRMQAAAEPRRLRRERRRVGPAAALGVRCVASEPGWEGAV